MGLVRIGGKFRLDEQIATHMSKPILPHHIIFKSTDELYFAHNIFTDEKVVVKLESLNERIQTLDHEFRVYKTLSRGHGIPHAHWFGTEAGFDAMVIERLGPSLDDLFVLCHFQFSLQTNLLLAGQLVSNVFNAVAHTNLFCVSSVACSIFILATSSITISNPATSSWVLANMRTWPTLLISDSQRSSGTLIRACTFHTAMVMDSLERPSSHPLIVTWAWNWEGRMIWSPSLTFWYTFFEVFCHGRTQGRILSHSNKNSSHMTSSMSSQLSLVLFSKPATHSPSTINPIMTNIITSSITSCHGKDLRVLRYLIGTLFLVNDGMLGLWPSADWRLLDLLPTCM